MRIKNLYLALTLAAALPLAGHAQQQYLKAGDFEKLYKNGIELFQAGKYAAAKSEFAKAKGFPAPEHRFRAEELDYYIALCTAEESGAGGEASLRGFLARYPDSPRGNMIHLMLGNIYKDKGEFSAALNEYSEVRIRALSDERRMEFHFNRGFANFSLGNYREALGDFDVAERDPGLGASATYHKAYIYYKTGESDRARELFTRLLSDGVFSDIAPFYIAHIDFQKGDYEKVIAVADGLISRTSGERRGEMMRITGESYYHTGDYAQALRYLRAYADQAGELTREELYMTGMSYYMTGDFAAAEDFLGKAAAGGGLIGQNAGYHAGNAYLRGGDKQRAMMAYSLAMKMDDDKFIKQEAMFNFAKLQYELGGGMFNETINTLTAYLEEFPDSPNANEAYKYLLAAYFNSQDYGAAYDALVKVKDPDVYMKTALQRIAYYRGLEYFTGGDYARALEMFRTASDNRYNAKITALSRFWMAETYYRLGEYTRAAPLYREYIDLSPRTETENVMSHYNLAYCYFNVRDMEQARVWFTRFTELYSARDGVMADAWNRLGDTYFVAREYSSALEQYDRAAATSTPEADYARYQRAVTLGLTSGAASKRDALTAIISADRGAWVDDAMYELATSYLRAEMFDQAIGEFDRFLRLYPDSPLYANALNGLGLAYQNTGRNDRALEYYKTTIEKYPNSAQAADALLGIRNIYLERGDAAGYFDFAAAHGMEADTGAAQRDSIAFAAAERIYISGDVSRAKPLLEAYLADHPRGNYLTDATYYIADAHMREGDTAKALEGYRKVASMPAGTFTENALNNGASLLFKSGEYGESASMYRRLADIAQTQTTALSALTGYLRSVAAQDGDPDGAIAAADYALASPHADDAVRAEAEFLRAKALMSKGETEVALPALRRTAEESPDTQNGAQARYLVIKALYDTKMYDLAEQEVFAFSQTDTPYRYWLGRAFLVLGDIYLDKGDTFQAKATFASIVDGYGDKNDGIVAEAAAKLESINE